MGLMIHLWGTGASGVFPKARFRSLKLTIRRLLCDAIIFAIGRFEDCIYIFRPATRASIILPDFVIAGAQKSGTTSLHIWLDQLPDFRMALMKVPYKKFMVPEIKFFSDPTVRKKGLRWYSSRFRAGMINGEKTPEYFGSKLSLREIRRYCPCAKIIIMLRNPVDRAFSAYNHYSRVNPRSRNWDWLLPGESFEDNLRAELRTGFSIGFLARGRYAEQLKNLYGLFPREQVKIVIFERFTADPEGSLKEIVEFLGGQPVTGELDFRPCNVGIYDAGMESGTREWLRQYYIFHNQDLYSLLGYRVNEWEI